MFSEEGLAHIQTGIEIVDIRTPTGIVLNNVERFDPKKVVAVSIIRAGDSMLDSFLSICTDVQVGKILIQRDEETAQPKLIYYKVPNLTGKQVILLDPMLATGGSAKSAIQVLLDHGAAENAIAFFTVVSCPEGIRSISSAYPSVKIVTGHIDECLNAKVSFFYQPFCCKSFLNVTFLYIQSYIMPGLGDFGDRYYGTI